MEFSEQKIIKTLILTIFSIVVLGLLNALFFTPELKEQGKIVAFRGGGSLVDGATGSTAASLLESGLYSVENTHQAVAELVTAGVDVIHLNVQRTSDDQLVVFHDWTLD
jgi:glycerophosphoryl diester phosphodiesterase